MISFGIFYLLMRILFSAMPARAAEVSCNFSMADITIIEFHAELKPGIIKIYICSVHGFLLFWR